MKDLRFEIWDLRFYNFNLTAAQIYFYLIALFYGIRSLRTFHYGKAHIKGISVKYPGKALCYDAGYACCLYGNGRMFSGRTAAKIFIGNNYVAELHFLYKLRVCILNAVFCEFLRVRCV